MAGSFCGCGDGAAGEDGGLDDQTPKTTLGISLPRARVGCGIYLSGVSRRIRGGIQRFILERTAQMTLTDLIARSEYRLSWFLENGFVLLAEKEAEHLAKLRMVQ
jgi:hypothetical protein